MRWHQASRLALGAAFALTLLFAACADAAESDTDPGGGSTPVASDDLPNAFDELVEKAAPIVSVDVVVQESAPPQYVARVVSSQPDGCHKFSRYEVNRDDKTIRVDVYNTLPADLTVVLCEAVYSETTSSVELGSDFESGETYALDVNGETQTFVAQITSRSGCC